MPRGDGTGPEGMGPMTGRGLGYCAGFSSPGFTKGTGRGMARGFGRGIGRGMARGFRGGIGRGRAYNPQSRPAPAPYPVAQVHPPYRPRAEPIQYETAEPAYRRQTDHPGYSKEQEVEYLKEYAQGLRKELEEIEARIDELSD